MFNYAKALIHDTVMAYKEYRCERTPDFGSNRRITPYRAPSGSTTRHRRT
jgi:hypothetical protein